MPKPTHLKNDTTALKGRLLSQLPRLVDCLFASRSKHRTAHEYRIGTNGSISIRRIDGSYYNHESGEGGDIFDLIQHTLKTDFKGALVFAKGFVGNVSLPPIPPSDNIQRKIDERAAIQRDKALAMINRAVPIKETLAEAYLRDKRGILLESLPASLKFIPHAYNFTAGGFHPAMIASICDVNGKIIAAHCTFLNPETGDKLQGKDIKSRLIFGGCRGGAIRLTEATERLALCEGIEDGLSILQCAPDWAVWACAGTSGFRAVQIPESVRELLICGDRDEAGMQAAHELSARMVSEGKKVRIAMPPEGVKDFNDLLRHGGNHAQ